MSQCLPPSSESSPDAGGLYRGLLILDDSGTILAADNRALRLLNRGLEETVGILLDSLFDEHIDLDSPEGRYRLVAQGAAASGLELDVRRTALLGSDAGLVVFELASAASSSSSFRTSWQLAAEAVGDAVWDWDLTTNGVSFSQNWLARLGYLREQLDDADKWAAIVHPNDIEHVSASANDLIEGRKQLFREEFRMQNIHGQMVWVESSARIAEWDKGGAAIRMLGVYREITERKITDERLRLAESRWQFALDGAGDGLWDWNVPTGEVFFSDQWKAMLGYQPHEIAHDIGEWRRVADEVDLQVSDALVEQCLRGESDDYRCEVRVICKDGTHKWILDRGFVAERDDHGTPLRMIGTHSDITADKRASEAVREAKQRLENIAELVPGFVYQFQMEADGHSRFPYASAGIEDIYDVAAGDVVNDATPAVNKIIDADRARILDSIKASARSLEVWQEEFRVRHSDGKEHWLLGIANPLAMPNGAVLWHGHITNIDERRATELERGRTSAALTRGNQDLEQFAYVDSHDLKEPLRAIGHLVEWIAEDLSKGSAPEVSKNLRRLEDRVKRMDALIDDLLAFARVGNLEPVAAPCDLERMIDHLAEEMTSGKQFQVNADVRSVGPFSTINAALETVLRNLISNAIKHHDLPEQGVLSINAVRDAEWLTISVTDDGPGIPPKHHARIFKLFQRLNPETGAAGTGIGLAIVSRILQSIGGEIRVNSAAAARGTEFVIRWPLNLRISKSKTDSLNN
ncbi:MAG: PAS domain-containing protein [Pseudomonadota bacterium]